jgi:hypothetical protein
LLMRSNLHEKKIPPGADLPPTTPCPGAGEG